MITIQKSLKHAPVNLNFQPLVKEWRNLSLEDAYPIMFLDGMYCKVRENGRVKNKVSYTIFPTDTQVDLYHESSRRLSSPSPEIYSRSHFG